MTNTIILLLLLIGSAAFCQERDSIMYRKDSIITEQKIELNLQRFALNARNAVFDQYVTDRQKTDSIENERIIDYRVQHKALLEKFDASSQKQWISFLVGVVVTSIIFISIR